MKFITQQPRFYSISEISPSDKLLYAYQKADEYRELAVRAVNKKLTPLNIVTHVTHTPNPEKFKVLYVFCDCANYGLFSASTVIMNGREGNAILTLQDNGKLLIIKSHAIQRYMQRTHFRGHIDDAIKSIVLNLIVNSASKLENGHLYYPIHGGYFVGYQKRDASICNTFIAEEMYNNGQAKSADIANGNSKLNINMALANNPILNMLDLAVGLDNGKYTMEDLCTLRQSVKSLTNNQFSITYQK